ncbi:MAG: hypothetical protein AAFV90_20855 [Cyanobacteria bacterium J06634_5]
MGALMRRLVTFGTSQQTPSLPKLKQFASQRSSAHQKRFSANLCDQRLLIDDF